MRICTIVVVWPSTTTTFQMGTYSARKYSGGVRSDHWVHYSAPKCHTGSVYNSLCTSGEQESENCFTLYTYVYNGDEDHQNSK